jgi:hypothetical protein
MRVHKFTIGLFLTTAILSATNLVATHAAAAPVKVSCLCDCPDDVKAKPRHAMRPVARAPRRIARASGYDYAAARPVSSYGWHSEWRQAPNDAVIDVPPMGYGPPPEAYGPPPGYDDDGLRVDNNGWSGGVGYGGEGGGGGGGGDSFGQVHFGTGGSVENGPTYNSYNQSFQYNPSQPGAFQPRLMGGFAPPASSK